MVEHSHGKAAMRVRFSLSAYMIKSPSSDRMKGFFHCCYASSQMKPPTSTAMLTMRTIQLNDNAFFLSSFSGWTLCLSVISSSLYDFIIQSLPHPGFPHRHLL